MRLTLLPWDASLAALGAVTLAATGAAVLTALWAPFAVGFSFFDHLINELADRLERLRFLPYILGTLWCHACT